MELFSKNWSFVFGSGMGLPMLQRSCILDKYLRGMPEKDIAEKRKISVSEVKNYITSHMKTLMNPRAYMLCQENYPLNSASMEKLRYEGYYDAYGGWVEPEYNKDKLYLNICLFNLFDYSHVEKFCKQNNILTIGNLCAWLVAHRIELENKKAGVGAKTAAILLDNQFVMHECTNEVPLLQRIVG
jgi:hypothetical protein